MRALLASLMIICAIGFAQSQSFTDKTQIETVISSQLEAFAADDAARAFSFAAPVIKRMFGDAERFVGMVRNGYPPVHRSAAHSFGDLREAPEGVVQEVFIRDRSGEEWVAIYTMERQPDGTWLIAGCRLLRKPGLSA
jgi:hypothetical protein